jgi:mycothiol synthase
MVEFEIKRNMTPQNIAEITQLLDAVEKAENRKPLNDHLWIDLRQGGRSGFAGLTARHQHTGQPIAYCQISRGNESWAIDLVLHPQHRSQTLDLGNALFSEASKIISGEGGGQIHWWVSGATSEHIDLAKKFDLHGGRTLLQMRVQLPLSQQIIAATTTIDTQSFRVGIDEDAWLTVNNRAFSSHPEQGGWTKQLLQSRQAEKWFDPDGFLLYFLTEISPPTLAAFCWTKIDHDLDSKIGEIYVIAVDPQFRGQGLGRSLTVAGLNYLASSGATTGMLFVDKENTAAVATYEKLGFTVDHQEQAFIGEIASTAKQS